MTVSNIHMDEDAREERDKKGTVDMTKLNADIAGFLDLAKQQDKLHAALEGLLNLEKTSRLAEEITATKASCSAILTACYDARDWKLLEENILLLSKRRSQLKQAVQAFVRQAITYVEQAPDKDTRVSLIKTLLVVTEGKIFVEIERARLTRRLANIKVEEGNISEAADILQEVPVETFGAMAKTEKIAFILEQVRLCLDKEDFIRAHILSKKISPRAFVVHKGEAKGEIGIEGTAIEAAEEGVPELHELKLTYYELMIRYYAQSNNYLEICRCYRAIYEADSVKDDQEKWEPILKRICWYLVLSPSYSTAAGTSSDRTSLMAPTQQDKRLTDLSAYKALLTTVTNTEIIRWPEFLQTYQPEINAHTDVFGGNASRLADLRLRVIEHNVLVIAKYYKRVTMTRLSELLDLPQAEAEKHISELVVSKAIAARMDRPAGIVVFGATQCPEEQLNSWANNIGQLLTLVEKCTMNIQKEAMQHKVTLK